MPSEFELIRRYFTHAAPSAVLGVGDDAALVRVRRGCDLAVSTDMLVAGRHFFPRADPALLGHKALAVNLSDMAAMGATPRWAALSLALPRADPRWLRSFSQGFMRLARRHGVDLVGGDTTRGPLNICVQILGEVPSGQALRRDGARAGDDVWVSGTLGDAALALASLRGRVRVSARERALLERRLHAPEPRVALGVALRGVAASAIDVSDGLVADLGHICERSRLGAVIEWERLPVSRTLAAYLGRAAARGAVLAGGDDYELCFTARSARRERVAHAAERAGIKVTRIGRIVAGPPRVAVLGADGHALSAATRGYEHFR
jgi:thiamine-monophosphate kinase